MKNVYFVQTNSVFGSGVRSAYLPYSIGTIAAYAWADERIKKEYCLKKFIFMRDDIDTIVASMEEPYFVGLSCYVWSMEFNKALAQKIKEIAREEKIEIVENKPLARMLYYNVDIDEEIPPELYQAVAEVLAFVYNQKNR